MWLGWLLVAAAEGATDEVARGWYLWRTGQDEAALTAASEALAQKPDSLEALVLHTAMRIVSSEGASVEAELRERWGEEPSDPVRRVALAYALTLRNTERGAWCDEVRTLLAPITEGELYHQALLADRERERRCTGQTDHADSALRTLVKGEKPGWVDGVMAEMEAGYLKDHLPDLLERAWAEQPERLDRAGALWGEQVAGPARAPARRVAQKALGQALDSDDPVLVHAALQAYLASEQTKDAERARARLAQLDPAANTELSRTIADVADPEIYRKIGHCARMADIGMGADCLGNLLADPAMPETGPVRAHAQSQRRMLLEALHRPDEAYQAARAAYEADPSHRFNARVFAKMALARADAQAALEDQDLQLAVEAADAVLFGREPLAQPEPQSDKPPKMRDDLRIQLARDLELRGRLLAWTGRPDEALADLLQASALSPSPTLQLRVGLALDAASRRDEAGLLLAHALLTPVEDTALTTRARETLARLSVGWDPGGLKAMLAAAARKPGQASPSHPLLGKVIADAALLPTPPTPTEPLPKGQKPPPPGIRVLFTWSTRFPESVAALQRVDSLAEMYRERGVSMVVLNVDPDAPSPPEGLKTEAKAPGPSAMRALMSVSLPTVVVLDGKGVVKAVLGPYDRNSLDLEKVLDGMVPKP